MKQDARRSRWGSSRRSSTDDVIRRMTAPPRNDGPRRAVLQVFMNRNDKLTDDAMVYIAGIEREARASALEYAAECFGKTTAIHLSAMARRIREQK